MKTTTQIAMEMQDLCKQMDDYSNFRAGGNLGMAFIAAAITDHAAAVRELAIAIGRRNEKNEITVNIQYTNTPPGTGSGQAVVTGGQEAVAVPVCKVQEQGRTVPPPDIQIEHSAPS